MSDKAVASTTYNSSSGGGGSSGGCQPACSPGQKCVGGTCVWLEKSTYGSYTTTKWCGWWTGYKECDGHRYQCVKHPQGITNCSATNCECDEDPC